MKKGDLEQGVIITLDRSRIMYKTVNQRGTWTNQHALVKLRIPKGTRLICATHEHMRGGMANYSRKCRVDKAVVVSITNLKKDKTRGAERKTGYSDHDSAFKYVVGETVTPGYFHTDTDRACAGGVHCFETARQAIDYVM